MKENRIKLVITFFIFMFFFSCTVSKSSSRENGDYDNIIHNAIYDFKMNNKKLLKRDSVFHLILFKEEYKENEFVKIIIIGSNKQFLYNKYKDPNENKFPSGYLDSDNILFFWYDDNKQIDSLTINTFKKYNLLVDDENGKIKFLDNDKIDDRKKGVLYFFCKGNIKKFEKSISNESSKYPKRLKCE
ncbi:hypothetical protein [Flavobacterium cheonhonense]|nr:hypothetical protein [Flavobacterium cheonhonense]